MKRFYVITVLIIFLLFSFDLSYCQAPPPPPDQHGMNNNQPAGNGAPIGTGMTMMAGLFAAYGAKKLWDVRKKLEE